MIALLREGFEGSYDAVRRYATRWAEARRKDPGACVAAFIPMLFKPGEAYQFDWNHEDVEIVGKPMRVKVASGVGAAGVAAASAAAIDDVVVRPCTNIPDSRAAFNSDSHRSRSFASNWPDGSLPTPVSVARRRCLSRIGLPRSPRNGGPSYAEAGRRDGLCGGAGQDRCDRLLVSQAPRRQKLGSVLQRWLL
jgi:hypothetical protein